tara:strand:- start:42 stop:1838 length:1797 start_codon:yes stop_codon:yes gene_type:complete
MSNIICSISRGHNASTTLMIDGKVIFYLEEERLSRFKRDGTPLLGMAKVYEYVDHIDHLVVCHTHRGAPTVDWTTEDLYKSWMRKLCKRKHGYKVTFIDSIHHEMHSDIAFINSGFDSAASVICDGAGSFLNIEAFDNTIYEFESIYHVKKGLNTKTVYKHYGTDEPCGYMLLDADNPDIILTEFPGIVKEYEAITRYCGFNSIEAGKTMGLSPYGQPNPNIPPMFIDGFGNRNLFKPNYPNGAYVVEDRYKIIRDDYHAHNGEMDTGEYTQVQKDLAYAIQKESEDQMCALIQKAHEKTGETNIVICGGYGLNCVANYKFKQRFPNLNIYVEPISHDGGTSMGGAYHVYYNDYVKTGLQTNPVEPPKTIYYGPQYDPDTYLDYIHEYPSAKVTDASYDSVAKLIREGNIVTIFQGRSEAGPRALGNRSILFDPTIKDGKDIVNKVKRREFFRPFACSILAETVHDWFDLAGMDESPSMMYAVDALPGVDEKIPSVIHVDGTCRIQTVTKEQNEHYYNLISAFEKLSNVPILFNTSFNLGGDPLVEDIDDALDTLSTSDINYMYLPEIQKLVEIKTREMQDTRQQPINILTETADTKL